MKKRTVIVLIVCVVLLLFPLVLSIQDVVKFSETIQSFADAGRLDEMWGLKYYRGGYFLGETYFQYMIMIWVELFILICVFISLLAIAIIHLFPSLRTKIKECNNMRKAKKIEKTEKKLKELLKDKGKPE